MADEARKLGIVFDAEAGRKAELFSDNLTRLQKVKEGVTTQVTIGMLPTMVNLTDSLAEAAMDADFMSNSIDTLTKIVKGFVVGGMALYGALKTVADVLSTVLANAIEIVASQIRVVIAGFGALGNVASRVIRGDLGGAIGAARSGISAMAVEVVQGGRNIGSQWSQTAKDLSSTWGVLSKSMAAVFEAADPAKAAGLSRTLNGLRDDFASAGKSADELTKYIEGLMGEAAMLTASMRTDLEKFADEMDRLDLFRGLGLITDETFDRAVAAAENAYDAIIQKQMDAVKKERELYERQEIEARKYFASREELAAISYQEELNRIENMLKGRQDLEDRYGEAMRSKALAELEKHQAQIIASQQSEIDRYMDVLLSQEQALLVSLQRRHDDIMANTLLTEMQKKELAEHYAAETNRKLESITRARLDRESALHMSYVQAVSGILGGFASLMDTENEKQFKAAKALSIAQATMNAYMAITATLAKYPPPAGAILAAAHGALAFAQISQIASQTYSGARDRGGTIGAQEYALVAERRPEFVSGTLLTEPTLLRGPARITSGAETERELARMREQSNAVTQEALQETTNVTQNFYDARGNFVEDMRAAVRTGELVPVIREALQAAERG
jgi:hypothetical protein